MVKPLRFSKSLQGFSYLDQDVFCLFCTLSHTCTVQFSRSYVRYYSVFDSNYQCLLSLFSSPLNTASMRYLSHADNSYATQILYVQVQMHAHVFLHSSPCVFPFVNSYPNQKSKCLLYHFSTASNWTNLLIRLQKCVLFISSFLYIPLLCPRSQVNNYCLTIERINFPFCHLPILPPSNILLHAISELLCLKCKSSWIIHSLLKTFTCSGIIPRYLAWNVTWLLSFQSYFLYLLSHN